MEKLIYKILRPAEWETLLATSQFVGSPDDLHDGFVHFSSKTQVAKTLNKHFKGEDHLILAEVSVSRLKTTALNWEVSTGGALYPHYYDEMRLGIVTKAWDLRRGADDQFILPVFEETTPIFEGGK